MSKIINIKTTYSIIFSLGILATLAVGAFTLPSEAKADCGGGYWGGSDGSSVCNPLLQQIPQPTNYYYPPTTYYQPPAPVYTPPPVYYNPPVAQNPAPAPAPTPSPTPTPTIYSSDTNPNQVAVADPDAEPAESPDDDGSDLSANASFGSGFMPSGVMQWIFFAILVMLIVILARKIYGGREKYLATPLKHK